MNKILVTGATGEIGKSLVLKLASQKHHQFLAVRNRSKAEGLFSSLKAGGAPLEIVDFDFENSDTFKMPEDTCLDGLVLMPPQPRRGSSVFVSSEEWHRQFDDTFVKPLRLIQALLPNLKKSKHAKIILISGLSSVSVIPNYSTSNVLRLAWLGQMKAMAHSEGFENISFITLSLGRVMTDSYVASLTEKASHEAKTFDELYKNEVSNVPLRKYATPVEVAEAVSAFLGPAGDHMTGVNIVLDGGFHRCY